MMLQHSSILPCRHKSECVRVCTAREDLFYFYFFACLLVTNCAKCQWYLVVFCRSANFYTVYFLCYIRRYTKKRGTNKKGKRVKRKEWEMERGRIRAKRKTYAKIYVIEMITTTRTTSTAKKCIINEWKSVSNLNNVKTRIFVRTFYTFYTLSVRMT